MASVVIQLNESSPDKHRAVLRNIKNLMDEMPDLHVELVVHGEGIALVTHGSEMAEPVSQLIDRNVTVAVCKNTLKMKKIDETTLLPGMTFVDAGIAELVRRQMEGYAYVKP